MKREIVLDDFTRREKEYISELVHDSLIDLGYIIESFSWQITVEIEGEEARVLDNEHPRAAIAKVTQESTR